MEPPPSPVTNDEPTETVSLVVPVRDEAEHIDRCLAAIIAQDYPKHLIEIIVIDGDSADDTAGRAQAWADRDDRIRVLHNPAQLMIPGLNMGLRRSSGRYVGVVIGHSFPAADYVRRCLRLLRDHDAWGVGGAYERMATTSLQRAIGRAQSHPFGVGDAFHNYGMRAAWAETVFPGFWPRWVFERVGHFDERMLYNEDNEFSHRIQRAGGRLWYDPSLRIGYSPRRSLRGLFRQYFRYGHGKAAVFREHPGAVRLRHLVPAALVAVLTAGALIATLIPAIGLVTAALACVYLALAAIVALSTAKRGEPPLLLAMAFVVMHIAYGSGMWTGLVRGSTRGS